MRYRKNTNGTVFYKIFPDKTAVVVRVKGLFDFGSVLVTNSKDIKGLVVCKKAEFKKQLKIIKNLLR